MSKARITRLIEITTLKSVDLKKVTRLVRLAHFHFYHSLKLVHSF